MMSTKVKFSSEIASQLVENLASSRPKITELVQSPIPGTAAIANIIGLVKQILFPGFCGTSNYQTESLHEYLESNVEQLQTQLGQQIAMAFALDQKFSGQQPEVVFDTNIDLDQHSKQSVLLAKRFIECLPAIRESLSTDLQAAFDGDPACKNVGEVILCYPGVQAVLVHRVAHELYRLQIPYLPRMMAEWTHGETGIDIHPGAKIGDHFFIDHGTGVVIGQTCVIGEHVKIYQGVTLGALSFPTDGAGALVRDTKRHPTIEDNVVIYANATVLGGQTIVGHDSVIGSSVWLTRSIDPFTTILMEKPKLHLRDQTPGDFEPPLNYQI